MISNPLSHCTALPRKQQAPFFQGTFLGLRPGLSRGWSRSSLQGNWMKAAQLHGHQKDVYKLQHQPGGGRVQRGKSPLQVVRGQRDASQHSTQVDLTPRTVLPASQGQPHPTRECTEDFLFPWSDGGRKLRVATSIPQDRLDRGQGEIGQFTRLMKGSQDNLLLFPRPWRLLVLVLGGVGSGPAEPPSRGKMECSSLHVHSRTDSGKYSRQPGLEMEGQEPAPGHCLHLAEHWVLCNPDPSHSAGWPWLGYWPSRAPPLGVTKRPSMDSLPVSATSQLGVWSIY